MKSSFYAGASGLIAQQQALNNIGNNIANVNTNGYQKQGISFEDLLYMEMYANSENDPNHGVGVKAVSTGLQVGQNPLKETNYPLDFAIVGDGFFAVRNGNEIQYTRDGAFAVSLEGNQAYLSTQSGLPVLNNTGGRIAVTKQENGIYNTDNIKDQLAVYNFDYAGALDPVSGNRYLPTAASGNPVQINVADNILAGALESSGVSLVDEMSNMIASQRAYQMSARVVQTADEIEQTINNLRK
ncbi:flagellar hook-basal body protein [Scatolibacter rhodanostii]|uniref:flagellar hook-basal body protein n=1 Tax=Scatolibacter rhodanostii TaxID=2014781 RepID=UPI000C077BFF|nr:flagellar hook-basal body protein [Scatolibacter rhodanostii]